MVNKRGQGLTVSTLIIIILAIVVLVFLVYGFSVGWGNLFDTVSNLGGGKSNVGAIVTACELACNTGSQFDYERRFREIKFVGSDEKLIKISGVTCRDLEQSRSSEQDHCEYPDGSTIADLKSKEECETTTGIIEWKPGKPQSNFQDVERCYDVLNSGTDQNAPKHFEQVTSSVSCKMIWVDAQAGWSTPFITEKCNSIS
ncbi:MAG: hypothetical protein IH948_08440 [Bacteroidetes bacterium]|nr:hypothetical protein [Bacteroidota bacterium]